MKTSVFAALGLLASIVPSTAFATCTGAFADSVADAQDAFSATCCTPYDGTSGLHYCAWSVDGWQCAEHDWAPSACDDVPPDPAGPCQGAADNDLAAARLAYAASCGETWDGSSGFHVCNWTDAGFVCEGPGTSSPVDPVDPVDPVVPGTCDEETIVLAADRAPAQPVDLQITGNQLTWRQIPIEGVVAAKWNVFRGTEYVTTVEQPSYTIPAADLHARHAVAAINDVDGVHSHQSLFARNPEVPAFPLDGEPVHAAVPFLDDTSAFPGVWETVFDDSFDGSGPVNGRWHFLDAPNHRETAVQNDQHAYRDDGVLRMDAVVNDAGKPEMSFLRTVNADNGIDTGPDGDDFLVDPTQGDVYVEAAVRFDQATDVYHQWWAFWLFVNDIDANGETYRAYDLDPSTGSEIDILEYAPDAFENGFNAAIFTDHDVVSRPDATTDNFAVKNALDTFGIDLVDGRYHTIGLYYTPTTLEFFIDGHSFWLEDDPAFVTDEARLGLQLTWEARDNNDGTSSFNPIPRFDECGENRTAATGSLRDGTVFVDYVRVHRLVGEGSANGRGAGEVGAVDAGYPTLDGTFGCSTTAATPWPTFLSRRR